MLSNHPKNRILRQPVKCEQQRKKQNQPIYAYHKFKWRWHDQLVFLTLAIRATVMSASPLANNMLWGGIVLLIERLIDHLRVNTQSSEIA
jgi:hypothetical protein